jgi:hypothetical protein
VSIYTVLPSRFITAPRDETNSKATCVSPINGKFDILETPRQATVANIIGRAAFLDPFALKLPNSGAPPFMTILFIASPRKDFLSSYSEAEKVVT